MARECVEIGNFNSMMGIISGKYKQLLPTLMGTVDVISSSLSWDSWCMYTSYIDKRKKGL